MKEINFGANGHPVRKHDFRILQNQSIDIAKAFAYFISPDGNFIAHGCVITNTGSDFTWTEGAIFYEGTLYNVAAGTTPITLVSPQPYWKIISTSISPSPLGYEDSSIVNAYIEETMSLIESPQVGDEGISNSLLIRNQRFGPETGDLKFIKQITNFDANGLGLLGTRREGWAVADGRNNTMDMRGRVPVGIADANPDLGNTVANDAAFIAVAGTHLGEKDHTLTVGESVEHTHDISEEGEHRHEYGFFTGKDDGNDAYNAWDPAGSFGGANKADDGLLINSGITDSGGGVNFNAFKAETSQQSGHTHTTSEPTGFASEPHNNVQPSTLGYWIQFIG